MNDEEGEAKNQGNNQQPGQKTGMFVCIISPDGVAPSRMVSVSASVNLPLHHKVQKFSSGTGSPGWSGKKGHKTVVVVLVSKQDTYKVQYSSVERSGWHVLTIDHTVLPVHTRLCTYGTRHRASTYHSLTFSVRHYVVIATKPVHRLQNRPIVHN